MIIRPIDKMIGEYFSLRSTDDIGDAIKTNQEIKVVCNIPGHKYSGEFTIVTLDQLEDPNKILAFKGFHKSVIPGYPEHQLFDFKFVCRMAGKPNTLEEKKLAEKKIRDDYFSGQSKTKKEASIKRKEGLNKSAKDRSELRLLKELRKGKKNYEN